MNKLVIAALITFSIGLILGKIFKHPSSAAFTGISIILWIGAVIAVEKRELEEARNK